MIQSLTVTCFPTGDNPMSSDPETVDESDLSVQMQGDVQWHEQSLSWTSDCVGRA